MKDENLIHVKLEYEEALQSKEDILSSEMKLLKLIKAIKRYQFYRMEELKLKLKLYQKIKIIKATIKKLQNSLPKIKIPEELHKEIKKTKEIHYDGDLESQLQEIQNKLNALQR